MPYCYVPSKEDLGTASQTKRPTSIVMMSCKAGSDFKEVRPLLCPPVVVVSLTLGGYRRLRPRLVPDPTALVLLRAPQTYDELSKELTALLPKF